MDVFRRSGWAQGQYSPPAPLHLVGGAPIRRQSCGLNPPRCRWPAKGSQGADLGGGWSLPSAICTPSGLRQGTITRGMVFQGFGDVDLPNTPLAPGPAEGPRRTGKAAGWSTIPTHGFPHQEGRPPQIPRAKAKIPFPGALPSGGRPAGRRTFPLNHTPPGICFHENRRRGVKPIKHMRSLQNGVLRHCMRRDIPSIPSFSTAGEKWGGAPLKKVAPLYGQPHPRLGVLCGTMNF